MRLGCILNEINLLKGALIPTQLSYKEQECSPQLAASRHRFFLLGEFSSCKLKQMQPSRKLSVAGDRSEISFANTNARLVIILLLARTSRLLRTDIHNGKWIVMQIIFVGYFCPNLVVVSLFTSVKKYDRNETNFSSRCFIRILKLFQ